MPNYQKKLNRWLLLPIILLIASLPNFVNLENVQADGVIIPEPICFRCPVPPPPPPEVPYLTVQSHQVNVIIDQQIATTRVDQTFRNDTVWSLEGTYIFPLPETAAIGEFSMWIEGERVEGQLFTKEEARRVYNDIVRKRLDPALLEYVGRDLFQASIFPIEPNDTRRVVIEYTQILPVDNGLIQYVYPLSTEKFSQKPLETVSVNVEIKSNQAIKAIYSPSHPVSIEREGNFQTVAGWEAQDVRPETDFELYYTISPEDIGLNLLSYQSRRDDGFFTLLIAPAIEADEIIAKDVVLVLDTSGSMEGEKMGQAQDALTFVLDHLNPKDRFNVVSFSTGVRSFAPRLVELEAVPEAKEFVQGLRAEGSTDINRALLEAMASVDPASERPVIMIFLTDGLPTSGITDTDLILNSVSQAATAQMRIFPFGVGDDVDTFLLDTLAQQQRGTSSYVRPGTRVDETISAFYTKVSTPVLADVRLTVEGVNIADTYPFPLPDIFAGTQLTVVGRYVQPGPATISLHGTVNGQPKVFQYNDLTFQRNGGAAFIPRLWATRKIGYLLNQIRLHGESKEAIDQIVTLSIRYGIITPYTSFLVEEPEEALSSIGRERIAEREFNAAVTATPRLSSGAAAVDEAVASKSLEQADFAAPPQAFAPDKSSGAATTGAPTTEHAPIVRTIDDKAFILNEGVWVDTTFDATTMTTHPIHFGTSDFFELLAHTTGLAKYFALGNHVIVIFNGQAYEMLPADPNNLADINNHSETPSTIQETWWCHLFPKLDFSCTVK